MTTREDDTMTYDTLTLDTRGLCPHCAACGITTDTEPTRPDHPRYAEIGDGGTKPLAGILCAACADALLDAPGGIHEHTFVWTHDSGPEQSCVCGQTRNVEG